MIRRLYPIPITFAPIRRQTSNNHIFKHNIYYFLSELDKFCFNNTQFTPCKRHSIKVSMSHALHHATTLEEDLISASKQTIIAFSSHNLKKKYF